MTTPLPAVAWRDADARPHPFRLSPCCDAAEGRAFVSQHGGVSIEIDREGVDDVLFCPWCGKAFEVRVRRLA